MFCVVGGSSVRTKSVQLSDWPTAELKSIFGPASGFDAEFGHTRRRLSTGDQKAALTFVVVQLLSLSTWKMVVRPSKVGTVPSLPTCVPDQNTAPSCGAPEQMMSAASVSLPSKPSPTISFVTT